MEKEWILKKKKEKRKLDKLKKQLLKLKHSMELRVNFMQKKDTKKRLK